MTLVSPTAATSDLIKTSYLPDNTIYLQLSGTLQLILSVYIVILFPETQTSANNARQQGKKQRPFNMSTCMVVKRYSVKPYFGQTSFPVTGSE